MVLNTTNTPAPDKKRQLGIALIVYLSYVGIVLLANVLMRIRMTTGNEMYEAIGGMLFGFLAIPVLSVILPFLLAKRWKLPCSFWPRDKPWGMVVIVVLLVYGYFGFRESIATVVSNGIPFKDMVLVDVAHEDELVQPEYRQYYKWVMPQLSAMRIPVSLGLARLMMALGKLPPAEQERLALLDPLTPEVRAMVLAHSLRSSTTKTTFNECTVVETTLTQLRATGSLDDLPLVVMTPTGPVWLPGLPPGAPIDDDFMNMWMELQKDLVTLSSNSTHILAEKSSHLIPLDEPDLVVQAIRHVVEMVRQREEAVVSRTE